MTGVVRFWTGEDWRRLFGLLDADWYDFVAANAQMEDATLSAFHLRWSASNRKMQIFADWLWFWLPRLPEWIKRFISGIWL